VILHPTDFSPAAREAFRLAEAAAAAEGARLVVLHVRDREGPLVAFGRARVFLQGNGGADEAAEELRRLRPRDPAVAVEYRLAEGPVVGCILEAAAQTGCRLIVLGHGLRPEWARAARESVAEGVRRQAPCGVVLVRPGDRPVAGPLAPAGAGVAGRLDPPAFR
jgi:nucleotide-binding universal stress UspA family protein